MLRFPSVAQDHILFWGAEELQGQGKNRVEFRAILQLPAQLEGRRRFASTSTGVAKRQSARREK